MINFLFLQINYVDQHYFYFILTMYFPYLAQYLLVFACITFLSVFRGCAQYVVSIAEPGRFGWSRFEKTKKRHFFSLPKFISINIIWYTKEQLGCDTFFCYWYIGIIQLKTSLKKEIRNPLVPDRTNRKVRFFVLTLQPQNTVSFINTIFFKLTYT